MDLHDSGEKCDNLCRLYELLIDWYVLEGGGQSIRSYTLYES